MSRIQNHEESSKISDKSMLAMFSYTHEYARIINTKSVAFLTFVSFTNSSSFRFCRPMTPATPADRLVTDIP